jgi:hypothetical protein
MAAVVYLVSDLLFTSKIRETAAQLGLVCQAARSVEEIAQIKDAQVLIVDLRRPDAMPALEAAPTLRKIGFIDHERVDVMEAARERGCTALAKGKFSNELARLLSAT